MTLTAHSTCTTCGLLPVDLQVPPGTSLLAVAEDLAAVTFEARVTHDIAAHLAELTS